MKKIQPRNVKGSRDFLPHQVRKRQYLMNVIREILVGCGFSEIETPAMESLETLSGKYGEEGDKLLFGILNSGDFLSRVNAEDLPKMNAAGLRPLISEKGLRYDLTVPLARYAVQHQNDLEFPFKRFHAGPVWRADRPQRGRYREFYLFDADVIGSTSVMNEVELTWVLVRVFQQLDIDVRIEVNHRAILEGMVASLGLEAEYSAILTAMDKLDKAGSQAVANELTSKGISAAQVDELFQLFGQDNLDVLTQAISGDAALKGIADIKHILEWVQDDRVQFSPALARGLDYYTGTIWEVKPIGVEMGTIAAGGRYDNLTEIFGGREMPGVGISFGVERIYDILEANNGFPSGLDASTTAMAVNFGGESVEAAWSLVLQLRHAGISCELYPTDAKLKKQMNYADKKKIPFVIFIGEEEMASGNYKLKDMTSGDQKLLSSAELIAFLHQG